MKASEADRLICTKFLAGLDPSERLQRAEEVCRRALDGFVIPNALVSEAERLVIPAAIARTGGIFVIDESDHAALVTVAENDDASELPPLPFPRMWFEVWSEEQSYPRPIETLPEPDGTTPAVVAYAVLEITPAQEWACFMILQEDDQTVSVRNWVLQPLSSISEEKKAAGTVLGDAPGEVRPVGIRLHPELGRDLASLPNEDQIVWNQILMAPVFFAQFISTLGAKHQPLIPLRARRREHQRRYGVAFPNIYMVDLRATGEVLPGHGDRQYHHRWIVRGHYRRDHSGRYMVPGKGICTWVRPYVKGPKGAPWKGRPIYAGGVA